MSNVLKNMKKPLYLVAMEDGSSMVSVDKPDVLSAFIQFKGYYVSRAEFCDEDIIKDPIKFYESRTSDLFVEVMIPVHRISYLQNLSYRAVKPVTQLVKGLE